MKKRLKKTAALFLALSALLPACLTGCRKSLDAGDLLNCADLLGKTFEEADIPPEKIEADPDGVLPDSVSLTGTLFGSPAEGSACCGFTSEEPADVFRHIYLYVNESAELDFAACREKLIELYGEPVSEGELPYVPVNNGALRWCTFETKHFAVQLAKGSETERMKIELALTRDELLMY